MRCQECGDHSGCCRYKGESDAPKYEARIAELEAYKAKLEALRDVMASLIALFAAEPPRTDANIARILFERCVYWYGVDSSVPVTLDSITNLQCGECHLNVGEICDICGAMGEGK